MYKISVKGISNFGRLRDYGVVASSRILSNSFYETFAWIAHILYRYIVATWFRVQSLTSLLGPSQQCVGGRQEYDLHYSNHD
jgi:hypothetical protein